MMKSVTSEKGMTLVELLIALVIFSVGLLAIASMQVTSIRTNMNANLGSGVVSAAQGLLEELMSRPGTDALYHGIEKKSTVNVLLPDGATYTLESTVTPDSPITDVATIVVEGKLASGLVRANLTGYKRAE